MYFLQQFKGQAFTSIFVCFNPHEANGFNESFEKPKNKTEKSKGVEDVQRLVEKADNLSYKAEGFVKKGKEALGKTGESLNKAKKEGLERGSDNVNEVRDTKETLGSEAIDKVFSEMPKTQGSMVISDTIQTEVQKSFESNPFDVEGLTEEEIQEEVGRRVVAAKVEEMGTRELLAPSGSEPGVTEAEFIKELEELHGLDNDALMSLRARNQAGIGSDIDTTGKITNPEEYKREMEELAQNAKKAQEFIAENQNLIDAGNATILAHAAAILNGENPQNLSAEQEQKYTDIVRSDASLGDGYSSMGRLSGGASGGFDSIGSGVGTISTNPAELANLPPANLEKAKDLSAMFGKAIEKYDTNGEFAGWNDRSALHKVVMKESGGIVGRLNYTFAAVAKRMGTQINDPQFVTYIHNKLKEGARASDFGIRSTATGVGQFIRANVLEHYPDKFQGIGDAENECIGMLRYIKKRYGTPENTVAQYGKHHEGY